EGCADQSFRQHAERGKGINAISPSRIDSFAFAGSQEAIKRHRDEESQQHVGPQYAREQKDADARSDGEARIKSRFFIEEMLAEKINRQYQSERPQRHRQARSEFTDAQQ